LKKPGLFHCGIRESRDFGLISNALRKTIGRARHLRLARNMIAATSEGY
jgi:hypothetical protein